jgi:hypothetical protein
MKIRENTPLNEIASALGKGILAGLAGTAAITLSQMIEMKITKRENSDAPVKVASEVTGVAPKNEEEKQKVNQEIHWAYGTSWGIARGMIALAGLKGLPAALVHFGAIWGSALIMLPKYDAAPPVQEQEPKSIAIDALHHAVYALAAGAAYDALDAGGKHERKFNKLISRLKLNGIIKNIF